MAKRTPAPPPDPVEALHDRLLGHSGIIQEQIQVIKDLEGKLYGASEDHMVTNGLIHEEAQYEEKIRGYEHDLLRIESYLNDAKKNLAAVTTCKDKLQADLNTAREKLTALYAEHKAILAKALAEAVRT